MPYTTVWEKNGVIVRFSGQIDAVSVVGSCGQTAADRRFGSIRYVLLDMMRATGVAVTDLLLEEMSAICEAAYRRNAQVAGLFVGPAVAVSFAMLFRTSRAGDYYPVYHFDTEDEARDWIADQQLLLPTTCHPRRRTCDLEVDRPSPPRPYAQH